VIVGASTFTGAAVGDAIAAAARTSPTNVPGMSPRPKPEARRRLILDRMVLPSPI